MLERKNWIKFQLNLSAIAMMAGSRIPHLIGLINQQTHSQEILHEYLLKAEALAQVTICTDFLDLSESIIYHHLWALSDMIHRVRNINERLLNTLLKEQPLSTDSQQ